jgi:hypothetical protein
MMKLLGACSPVLLAATMTVGDADAQAPRPAQPQQITAIGCVTRNGVVDVDKGVRRLNMDPNGLALTTARIVGSGTNRSSAVPGSVPEGINSGTIPRDTIVGSRTEEAETVAFALTGDRVKALGEQVGRRIEVVGRVTSNHTGGEQPRESAHPSTELPKLEVLSFRSATGACP